jgi:hypothetical protein
MAFASAISTLDDLKHTGLSLIFDNTGDEPTARYAAIYDRYQAVYAKLGEPTLVGLAFRSMIDTLPLQGADMLAWETYFHSLAVMDTPGAQPRPHLMRYAETGRFFALLLSRARIIEHLEKIKTSGGNA